VRRQAHQRVVAVTHFELALAIPLFAGGRTGRICEWSSIPWRSIDAPTGDRSIVPKPLYDPRTLKRRHVATTNVVPTAAFRLPRRLYRDTFPDASSSIIGSARRVSLVGRHVFIRCWFEVEVREPPAEDGCFSAGGCIAQGGSLDGSILAESSNRSRGSGAAVSSWTVGRHQPYEGRLCAMGDRRGSVSRHGA
jgi:hypothetical protein